ncbi:MAG: FN3 associated domain-containing protein [Ginsengibacter sp.]
MQRWRNIIFNITFSLNVLLLFLLIFDDRLHLSSWLQVVGRMHTMFVHFPIVMLALCIFWELFSGYRKSYDVVKEEIGDGLLLAAAITSVITALMGLFLSREDGYTPDLLVWHKYGGVFLSFLSLAWYTFRVKMREIRPVLLTTALGALVMIIITGHLGANITHGADFLLAPVISEPQKPIILFEDAVVYEHMVQPIIEAKCVSCHNSQKAKGELVLETKELLLKGGKDGKLWDSTEADFGLLMQRIHLPLQSKKHMPPQGKLQLTDEEIEIFRYWIKGGASFTAKLASLPERDTLRLLAAPMFQTIETDDYTFAPPDEGKVKALNNNYRVVKPLAIGSPALGVEFFSTEKFKSEQLKELLSVKDNIVKLNLNKMPVTDEDLKVIGQMSNLRKLNLSFTGVTGVTLSELSKLPELKSLSLSGTEIKSANLPALTTFPKLTQLFVWNTSLPPEEIKRLHQQMKKTTIETGYKGDTVVIKLNPPVIENEEQIISKAEPLKLKHYINGVVIRYTTDGTEPDSLTSPVYKEGAMLDKQQTIKAKAFKPGWISSDVVKKIFYKAGVVADSIRLINDPDPQYKGEGVATLHDNKIGSLNFRDGMWLGYRAQPMEAMYYFNKEAKVSSVTISSVINITSYLWPPEEIQVWGGKSEGSLRLLKRTQPPQPTKEGPSYLTSYDVNFAPSEIKVLKLIVKPVSKLPVWLNPKRERGWIFVDEVFLN